MCISVKYVRKLTENLAKFYLYHILGQSIPVCFECGRCYGLVLLQEFNVVEVSIRKIQPKNETINNFDDKTKTYFADELVVTLFVPGPNIFAQAMDSDLVYATLKIGLESAICRRIEQKLFSVVLLVSLAVETLTSFTPFDVSPNVSSRLEGPVAGPNRDAL